ncbi:MAG: cytochrome b N-terminal domain-containing protein [Phycisphaerales bacterium]|nr:cytochrome b N-terminal domain-containing protein [Phycisphaerales bacterium]
MAKHPIKGTIDWFDDRLEVTKTIWPATAGHTVPANAKWWYVFGSATMAMFMLQLVTGICLALVYVPSADHAWDSLIYLNFHQPLGWFLRSIHFWGSTAMAAMITIHMTQVFLFGAYKYPRELTWVIGFFLLICTFGIAFTGQVLRFDQDAYWGLGIGAAMMGRIPWIGPEIVDFIMGGPILGAQTLSRFFTLHVFVLPGAVLMLLFFHLYLVLRKGISEMPVAGKRVSKRTYEKQYFAEIERTGVPFFPNAAKRDLIFIGILILVVGIIAAVVGPHGPNGPPDPMIIYTTPRPDWYFMWIFSVLALLPREIETFLIMAAPVGFIVVFTCLPFWSGTGERHWRRRPAAVIVVILLYVSIGLLTYIGFPSPWSPHMMAGSGVVSAPEFYQGRTPLEMQGAVLFQYKECRNCHAIGGLGGQRGPDLSDVATRLTDDQLRRQIIQGDGNMPAFGKNLSPAEVDALVAYLRTLVPEGESPAQPPSHYEIPALDLPTSTAGASTGTSGASNASGGHGASALASP